MEREEIEEGMGKWGKRRGGKGKRRERKRREGELKPKFLTEKEKLPQVEMEIKIQYN